MSGVPVETVVELLIANYVSNGMGVYVRHIGRIGLIAASDIDELRTKVRDYLLALVHKPVMLSECEEGKPYWVARSEIVVREGCGAYRWTDRKPLGFADQVQVIQPVEVK